MEERDFENWIISLIGYEATVWKEKLVLRQFIQKSIEPDRYLAPFTWTFMLTYNLIKMLTSIPSN